MSKKELIKIGLNRQQRFLILCLFLITFTLGTSEFVIIGLLNDIASNLKISISEAGTLISGFAVAFAIGTPVLTAILSRFSRFPLILFLINNINSFNIVSLFGYSPSDNAKPVEA